MVLLSISEQLWRLTPFSNHLLLVQHRPPWLKYSWTSQLHLSIQFILPFISIPLQLLLLLHFQFSLNISYNLIPNTFTGAMRFHFPLLWNFSVLLDVKLWLIWVILLTPVDDTLLVFMLNVVSFGRSLSHWVVWFWGRGGQCWLCGVLVLLVAQLVEVMLISTVSELLNDLALGFDHFGWLFLPYRRGLFGFLDNWARWGLGCLRLCKLMVVTSLLKGWDIDLLGFIRPSSGLVSCSSVDLFRWWVILLRHAGFTFDIIWIFHSKWTCSRVHIFLSKCF